MLAHCARDWRPAQLPAAAAQTPHRGRVAGESRARASTRARSTMDAVDGRAGGERDARADKAEATTARVDGSASTEAPLERAFGAFSLGASRTSAGGRGGGRRSFRQRATARGARAESSSDGKGTASEGVEARRVMWGAFAERMNREQTSPVKTFELNAMPEKRSSRRTPSASSTDGERERPSVARSIERELLEDMTGESASAPEIVTSPEPMAVDSPGEDSDASESMRVTPPPSKFSMGASGASGSGTRKSASFRSNASPLRVEIRTESTEAETPASTKSEEFTLRASPTSPVVSPAEAKKFTFNAPPSKSPSVMRKVRSPDASNEAGGIFKMGTDGVQPTPKPRSNNRYAQRAGSIRRTVSG